MSKVIFSAFADEYSQNFDEQIQVLLSNDIHFVELRNINGKSLSDFSFEEIDIFKKKLDENNIKVSAIGSPLGKIDISDDFEKHLQKAEKIYQIANKFETKYIRMFSFYNKNNIPFDDFEKEVFIRIAKLIDLADKYGLILCHENEALIYGESFASVHKLVKRFNGKLKVVFDMGNYVLDGYDPIKAYEMLKCDIQYFHLKDALYEGAVVPAGKGNACIKDIVKRYIKDFNRDVITTIEPHLETFDGLNSLVGKSFTNPYKFNNAKEAFIAGVNGSKEELK